MKNWINFDELRKQLSFLEVLKSYDVSLTPKRGANDQYVATCPLPAHRDARGMTFSANVSKGIFQCFGCRASGNVIDFAVLMEGKEKKNGKEVRAVAMMLQEKFVKKEDPAPPAHKAPPKKAEGLRTVVNQPLDFELKTLEAEHEYFRQKKLSPETVARFGLGFCRRGFLAGRIAIPLVDDSAELVGYAGLIPNAPQGDAPQYLFPPDREHDGVLHVFDRSKFLYNGFRISKAVKDLIVVGECHAVWRLWEGSFANVVALMGDRCSDEQAAMISLLTSEGARVWLLTDASPESEACAETLLLKVTASRMCRWVKVGTGEEIAPEHPLLAALPKR